MKTERDLIIEYSQYGFIQSGELYLPLSKAEEFVEDCHRNNIAVIGMEAFKQIDGQRVSLLDQIADFSYTNENTWQEMENSCYTSSKDFLHQLTSDIAQLICFTLYDRRKWEERRSSPVYGVNSLSLVS